MDRSIKKKTLGIVGLGYVGLPLAIEFGKKFSTIGYDTDDQRIKNLKNGNDSNNEFSKKSIKESTNLNFTNKKSDLKNIDIFIITVPTPIKKSKLPDLRSINSATKLVGKYLKKGSIVIFESTVYPGLTENHAVPIIEKISNLKLNKDFYCGYSPERINPGDKIHDLKNIVKVVSASNKASLEIIDKLYKSIIKAGTHRASSIAVAEAAKVIENSQRDLNIAFVNELSIIFNKLKLDTSEILDAAMTKWNFLPFRPGLVGGHCIGVDPYYLTFIAKKKGYTPKVILAGRNINNQMGIIIAKKLLSKLEEKNQVTSKTKILIMGLSFKENCRDIRNSQVIKIIDELKKCSVKVDVYDPIVNESDSIKEYNLKLIKKLKNNLYDGIIIAVSHKKFKDLGIKKIKMLCKKNGIIFDVKSMFKKQEVDLSL